MDRPEDVPSEPPRVDFQVVYFCNLQTILHVDPNNPMHFFLNDCWVSYQL